MKPIYLVQMSRRGCLQEPEMIVDRDVAVRCAVAKLAHDGDLEGSDVAVDELVLHPLHVKRVVHPREIADMVATAFVDGKTAEDLDLSITDLVAVQPMTGLSALCETDAERAVLAVLTRSFTFGVTYTPVEGG